MKNSKTAILIFANSAEYEASRKPFYKANSLFKELNETIEKKVKQTNIPYFVISEKNQIGTTFGERFTNAIQTVFDKGYDSIITLGNDTPHIKSKHIIEAYNKLASKQTVIGKSNDGGFYLLGISKTNFSKLDFLNLPWQKSSLFSILKKNFLDKNINFSSFESLIDIDSISDAEKIVHNSNYISTALKLILTSMFFITSEINSSFFSFKNDLNQSHYFNKGSPFLNDCRI